MTADREAQRRPGTHTDFVLNDQVDHYPTRTVRTSADPGDLDALVRDGYLVHRGMIGADHAEELAETVIALSETEADLPEAEYLPGENIYLRSLLDKDVAFHPLLRLEPALSIARSVLGPQVRVEVEARMNYPGKAGVAVPWHAHLPVIPHPLPPLFSHPHQIHCLLYLRPVTEQEGALCLLPGSHADPHIRIPLGDGDERPGEVRLYFEPGDAVLIHADLWHRSMPSTPAAGARILLLLGLVPAWIRAETGRGVAPRVRLSDRLRADGRPDTKELLGDFEW